MIVRFLNTTATDDRVDKVIDGISHRDYLLVPFEHEGHSVEHRHALLTLHSGKGVGIVDYIHAAVVKVMQ